MADLNTSKQLKELKRVIKDTQRSGLLDCEVKSLVDDTIWKIDQLQKRLGSRGKHHSRDLHRSVDNPANHSTFCNINLDSINKRLDKLLRTADLQTASIKQASRDKKINRASSKCKTRDESKSKSKSKSVSKAKSRKMGIAAKVLMRLPPKKPTETANKTLKPKYITVENEDDKENTVPMPLTNHYLKKTVRAGSISKKLKNSIQRSKLDQSKPIFENSYIQRPKPKTLVDASVQAQQRSEPPTPRVSLKPSEGRLQQKYERLESTPSLVCPNVSPKKPRQSSQDISQKSNRSRQKSVRIRDKLSSRSRKQKSATRVTLQKETLQREIAELDKKIGTMESQISDQIRSIQSKMKEKLISKQRLLERDHIL